MMFRVFAMIGDIAVTSNLPSILKGVKTSMFSMKDEVYFHNTKLIPHSEPSLISLQQTNSEVNKHSLYLTTYLFVYCMYRAITPVISAITVSFN